MGDAPEGVTFNPGTTGGLANSDEQRKSGNSVRLYIDKNQSNKRLPFLCNFTW